MYIYLYKKVYKFNKNGLTFEIEQDIRSNKKIIYNTYPGKVSDIIVRLKLGVLVDNKEGGISLIKNKSIIKYKNKKDLFDSL